MKEIQRLCKHEIGIIDDDLEELINTIYTNKMHLLFDRYMK